MFVRLAVCAMAGAAILFAGLSSDAQSATATALSKAPALDLSAAKKQRRTVRHPVRPPSYPYRVPAYGRLNDPSLSPSGLPYRRPSNLGGCVFDEGYGRFSACPNE
ncbi:hypothetical protein [Pseudorhodoplanes sp.]|uniref:hypothetical protein n=1 Tax=Pseudorhodoplanes sp. TaxID=1934341 RepID=UPI002BE390BF|nr:hypothetical protein [Pseudorhodoplanes sp.]HWV50999.1 hypothetical protein [Pseudorhodoplanes sp.]